MRTEKGSACSPPPEGEGSNDYPSLLGEESQDTLRFLVELRSRLVAVFVVFLIIFSVLLYFANHLYTWFAQPLLKVLPQGHLIATRIVSPFFVPFKLAGFMAVLLGIPYLLYQVWTFSAPALHGHERRFIWPALLMSIVLFYLGNAFAYFVIFPLLFHFLVQTAPQGVLFSPDMNDYLDFTTKLLLIFGGLFEIPILVSLCVARGWVTRMRFIKLRPYAILGAFIVGMLFAPPDVLSQTILAIPIWLLYEIGILLSRWL